LAATTAFGNGSLQGGYLILAARVLGHDCGPMSGLHNAKVNQEFFPGAKSRIKSNFLFNLGLQRSLEASSAQPAPELRRGVRAAVTQLPALRLFPGGGVNAITLRAPVMAVNRPRDVLMHHGAPKIGKTKPALQYLAHVPPYMTGLRICRADNLDVGDSY
jgi:hypothetical protein